jgi:hypothetical protein
MELMVVLNDEEWFNNARFYKTSKVKAVEVVRVRG